jgi:hypothetical protein
MVLYETFIENGSIKKNTIVFIFVQRNKLNPVGVIALSQLGDDV